MTSVTTRRRATVRYRSLFPALDPARPVGWYFAEQLLEARSQSTWPTNSRGPDEDVNAYLIGLLACWSQGDPRGGVRPGRDPLLRPVDGLGPAPTIEHLRRQADHRLLALGLFDRGDLVRRRRDGWCMSTEETRARDIGVARHCYELAASMATGRRDGRQHLAIVWRKLANGLEGYLHVLQTLARCRLGLGARLSDGALQRLLADE